MSKVSVVVPVYYNAQSLPLLSSKLLEVEQKLNQKGVELELIFVDDGSGDGSLQELLKFKKHRQSTRIIKLTRNFGAIHALKVGAQFVTGDCFVFLVADLQDPPELIVEMVDRWQAGNKYVICVRTERNDPLGTKIFAHIYYRLLRLYVVKDFPEGGYDLALMDRVMLPYFQQGGKTVYAQVFMYWLGFRPEVLYYTRQKRFQGRSRWTFAKKLSAFLDVLLGFSVVPIRMISLLGWLVSLMSFGYGAWAILVRLFGRAEVPGFATLASLISFLLGLVIIMLGIIGEYLWRIFEETNKRPETVIDEVY